MRSFLGTLILGLLLAMTTGCGDNPWLVDIPDEPLPVGTPQPKKKKKAEGLPTPRKPEDGPKKATTGDKPERRNIIVVTERAALKLRDIIRELKKEQNTTKPFYLRVSISKDFERKFYMDPDVSPEEDLVGESRGILTVVDRKSALSVPVGTLLDYTAEGNGFAVSAPEEDHTPADPSILLAQARRGMKTVLARRSAPGEPPPRPPAGVMNLVKYESSVGKLSAYLTPDTKDGKKHPAIIWITGGDCNTIGSVWGPRPASNDQTAAAYRKAGFVMMFPSLRGGNDNPGAKEGFYGEVDDILAAADYLSKLPYVDPKRIYLGGHSTGGTMVLLVAECSDKFRAVFSFGPMEDTMRYGPEYNPYAVADAKERRLRTPIRWLHSIRSPVFVIEGTKDGNLRALKLMSRASKNSLVKFLPVKGANHFDVLAPTNDLIVKKLLRDTGPACKISITEAELNKPFAK